VVFLDHFVELVVPIHQSLFLRGMLVPGHLNASLVDSFDQQHASP
jgi:hypothetical protein